MKLKRTLLSLSVLSVCGSTYAAGGLDVTRVIDENQVGLANTCLIMNDSMESSPDAKDISSFVSIENRNTGKQANANIVLNGNSICLTGLDFGTKYLATLKKGLRSAESSLTADKQVEFTTIDRGLTAEFLNGNILATKSKEKKIGVQTINMDKFRITLFKISHNDLPTYESRSLEDFSDAWSSSYYLSQHAKVLGSKLYTVNVKPNEKQLTLVDLNELTSDLTSGIYAVMLSDGDSAEFTGDDADFDSMTEGNSLSMVKSLIISNIGVTSYQDNSGIAVAVRSLNDSKPLAKAQVKLISKTNDVLETVTTDENGYAQFSQAASSGKRAQRPVLVNVTSGSDFFSLDLRKENLYIENNAETVDKLDPNYKIFAYTNRTLVRPGEKVFYEAIVRNKDFVASDLKALKLMVYRPDGLLFKEVTLQNPKAGAFDYEFAFDKSSPTGTWRFALGFDKNKILNNTEVTVDSFIPSSILPAIKTEKKIIAINDDIQVDTKFTYGTPAPGIAVDGNFTVMADNHPVEKYSKYYFGINDDQASSYTFYEGLETKYTGKSGTLLLNLSDKLGSAAYPRQMNLHLNVMDPNSKLIYLNKSYKIAYPSAMPGIKFDFDKDNATHAKFPVIIADQSGTLHKGNVSYTIQKKHVSYQFAFRDGSWQYLRNQYLTPVISGELNVGADEKSVIDYELENGSYVVTLNYKDQETSANFYAGSMSNLDAKYPDRIELYADQKKYRPGDTAVLEFESAYDGFADLFLDNVKGNRIKHYEIKKGHNKIKVDVGNDFKKGSYALLSTYSDGENKYLGVQRSVGLTYLDLDTSAKTLNVSAELPKDVKPNSGLDIKIKVDGADSNTYLTASLIDHGILSINNQKAPSPEKMIYGKEPFSTEINDAYAYLMKNVDHKNQGYGGDDDSPIGNSSLSNITEDLLSYYTRTVKVENGYATVHYDLKDISSTASFMVSAWSADKLGSYAGDVVVRDNTVTKLNLPYYLHNGDKMQGGLSFNNLGKDTQVYNYKVNCTGALSCKAEGSIRVNGEKLDNVAVDVTAKDVGDGFVEIAVDGKDYKFNTSKKFHVLSPLSLITENRLMFLKAGSSTDLTFNNKFLNGTPVSINVGKLPLTNTEKLIKTVTESNAYNLFDQASAGLAALHVLQQAEKSAELDKNRIRNLQRFVNEQAAKVQSKISNYGGVAESFNDYQESEYATAYAGLFLVQAHKAGFNVNKAVLNKIKERLTSSQNSDSHNTAALSMYVLTLMDVNVKTNLVYRFDHINDQDGIPAESMSYYSQTFGLYGDTQRQKLAVEMGIQILDKVNRMINTNVSNYTVDQYITHINNILKVIPFRTNNVTHDALSLIKASLKAKSSKDLDKLYGFIEKSSASYDLPSIEELIAMSAEFGSTPHTSSEETVKDNKITVKNGSSEDAVATVTAHGYVTKSTAPKGLSYTQELYSTSGTRLADPVTIPLNQEIIVVDTFEYIYPYSGTITTEHKIPANTVFVRALNKDELKKKYPSIPLNDNFGYPEVSKGDSSVIMREYRYKARKISSAYIIKAAHPGTSAPLMSSGFIKDGNTSMFSSYNAGRTLTVK